MRDEIAAIQSIATSNAQNDHRIFELFVTGIGIAGLRSFDKLKGTDSSMSVTDADRG